MSTTEITTTAQLVMIGGRCYGCNSRDPAHHGWFCEFAGDGERDLVCYSDGNTEVVQHDRVAPLTRERGLATRARNAEHNSGPKGKGVVEWTPEGVARKMALPGFIVLAREPGANDYRGIVEGSFSLDISKDRTQFFWTSDDATSNFGGSFKVDGRKNAEREVEYWGSRLRDWSFEIFDARDDALLPVELDWIAWLKDSRRANTLSGVENKYGARNLRFSTKS